MPTFGEALFGVVKEQDFEGIVAKQLDAPYRAGRPPRWRNTENQAYSRSAGSRDRTHDLRFTKPLLYQLSYAGVRAIVARR